MLALGIGRGIVIAIHAVGVTAALAAICLVVITVWLLDLTLNRLWPSRRPPRPLPPGF